MLVIARYTLRYLFCIALREHGYVVYETGSPQDGMHLFDQFSPQPVIFEPSTKQDALPFIRELRQKSQAPLMLMSANSSVELRAAALDTGADDFIPASLNTVEVLARLRALMRRATWTPERSTLVVGAIAFDTASRRLCVYDQEVSLTVAEARLMVLLLMHVGEVVTYLQFMASAWGQFTKKEINLLRTHMDTPRRKVEASSSLARIVTQPQMGYRLQLEDDFAR